MRSHTTRRFRQAFSNLPGGVQERAREAYRRFQQDPFHASLQFQRTHTTGALYSVRLGIADASIVVLAERYNCLDVLTLDQRDFRVVRGSHAHPFRLLPQDAG